jgi:hypothetical protein
MRELAQVDGQQNHVQQENGIEVGQEPICCEQDVAHDRQNAQWNDPGHAECSQDSEGCRVSRHIDPRHRHSD